jgi:hypothetical protein
VVKEPSHGRAKAGFQVQLLAGGPFSSRSEIIIMQRFERCVAGGSPAVRSSLLRVAEQSRPPPSKRNDAGAIPAAGTFGGCREQFPERSRKPRCGAESQWRNSINHRHWLVAQKQSTRPISEGRRSITVRANHFGGLISEAGSRGANACGPAPAGLRSGTSTLRHCRVV